MAQPASAGGKGPVGQPRDAGQQGLLSLITCNIYGLYWTYLTGEELKEHNRDGMGGVALLLLCFVVVGPFLLGSEIEKTYRADGREPPVTAITALWLLLPIVGPYMWVSKAQAALNDYWVSKGATAA